jgi:hypothetical protein
VPEILITHLTEGIGIALDVPGNRMFVTDLAGSVYSADLDGKNERNFLSSQGNLTGVAYAEMQSTPCRSAIGLYPPAPRAARPRKR